MGRYLMIMAVLAICVAAAGQGVFEWSAASDGLLSTVPEVMDCLGDYPDGLIEAEVIGDSLEVLDDLDDDHAAWCALIGEEFGANAFVYEIVARTWTPFGDPDWWNGTWVAGYTSGHNWALYMAADGISTSTGTGPPLNAPRHTYYLDGTELHTYRVVHPENDFSTFVNILVDGVQVMRIPHADFNPIGGTETFVARTPIVGGAEFSYDSFRIAVGDGLLPGEMEGSQYDLDANGVVGTGDLLILLSDWGTCPDAPTPCPGDVGGNELPWHAEVTVEDLLALLGAWGTPAEEGR